MYIYDTSRYLEIINHGLNGLLPQLQDDQSKAVVGILQRALKELYKREARTPALLVRTNPEGIAIAREILDALGRSGADTSANQLREIGAACASGSQSFDTLQQQNNRLNALLQDLIAQLGARLREATPGERSAGMLLLRRAADWDYACASAQREPIEFEPFQLGEPPTGQDLDPENLQRLIDARRPGEGLKVAALKPIPGGMGKHTWGLSLARTDGTREELIVRKEGPRPLVSRGAWRIAAEYRLLERVVAAGFNAPKPLMLIESDPAFDADFFIMERKSGVVPGNFFGPTMEIREELLLDLAAHMARLHSIPIETFGDYLRQYMDPRLPSADVRTTYRLELEYWQRYIAENELPVSPALAYITEWMLANIPDNRERAVLVHGDLNIHNFLVEEQRISTVLDWELALPGDPAQDIAYVKPNIEKLIAWDKFMACYYEHGGRRIDESTFNYYIAFANYRPLVVSLRNMALLRDRSSDDVRLPYVDTEFVPQFVHNILSQIRGMNARRFELKLAFVSGAAGGIGRALACAFAREGARLALTDADAAGLESTMAAVRELGAEALGEPFDITRSEAIERFLARAVAQWGRLDCAVNNAGIRSEALPLADFSEAAYDRLMAINTKSVWLCMKHEIRLMLAQQPTGGAIVNVASGAGLVAVPGAGTYVASKHAVIGLTKAGAADYARHGIRINALCPGYTRTPMALGSLADSGLREEQVAAALPAGRVAEPEEQAAAALFLCSEDARYMAGHALVVDGGHSIV